MKPTSPWNPEFSELPEDRPDLAADARWLLFLCLLGFAVSVGVRLLELLTWGSPLLWAGGERLLSTHDAYCWLAGAKGVNDYANFGLSWLARALSGLTGAPLWAVGFWAPPFLASLTAVATGLWGWLLGGRRAAIAPACLGALSTSFFYRSRLGYFDTDAFTQLMPLLLGFGLALVIARSCRRAWVAGDTDQDAPAPEAWMPFVALGFGLLARVAHFAHDDVQPLGVGLFWLAVGLVLVVGLKERRATALANLLVFLLAGYAGPRRFGVEVANPGFVGLAGIVLAAGLAWFLWRRAKGQALPQALEPWLDKPLAWLALLAAGAVACGMLLPLGVFWAKALSYFKPVMEAAGAAGATGFTPPVYPGITQSIREAKNVSDLLAFFTGVSLSPETGMLGLAGVTALLTFRPAFLLLLPSLALAFASLKLGMRFSMFGGPIFALGLGVGLHWAMLWACGRFNLDKKAAVWAQVILVTGYVMGFGMVSASTIPTPSLAPLHAEALMALRERAPKDADIWTWWDYGYSTQYYAERMTPVDGGRHEGREIFPTALALMTPSFRQSAQMIRLSSSLDNNPAKLWDKMPAAEVKNQLRALAAGDQNIADARTHYIVVCWESVQLLYWMAFYGTWDIEKGTGQHASVMHMREPFDIHQDRAEMTLKRSGENLPLASVDLLSEGKRQQLSMPPNPKGGHLIVNEVTRQAFLLDDLAYYSMAVQLLIGDPQGPEQSRYFKLVHEGYPLVRIYEVLAPADVQNAAASPQAKATNK